MVSLIDLPPEILYSLFNYAMSPLDYYHLGLVHPLLHRISHEFSTRYSFLSRTLVEDSDNNNTTFSNNTNDALWPLESIKDMSCELLLSPHLSYRSVLCRFLATSPIPLSSSFAIDLLEMVPTSHFFQFVGYPDTFIKKNLLQSFRHRSSSYQIQYRHRRRPLNSNSNNTQITIPTLTSKTAIATALTCNRHRVMDGVPRRVYYHVTLHKPFNLDPTFTDNGLFCLMHDTDTVVGFDHQLAVHHGKLWYEDEGIIADSSWSSLLEVLGSIQLEYRDIRPSPVGYYDHHKTTHHRGWRPCLLKTLFDCRLLQDVRKGGLRKGDRFDCVFVYEHREDDTICLEFCLRDRHRWVPQGFLLFTEHHIVWSS